MQPTLFGREDNEPEPKPAVDREATLRVLITVKAAPNPSERYGETVCVAGIRAELDRPGWVRLYPINFRALEDGSAFQKYDIIEVPAVPARGDHRRESWRPRMDSVRHLQHLDTWRQRRGWLDDYVESSMCDRNRAARDRPDAQSLALIHPREVIGLDIERHPGWTPDEQRKIDAYVSQLDLLSATERSPLTAPRFRAYYRYQCHDRACGGHRQGLLDWEFVVLQRRLESLDDLDAMAQIRAKFVDTMCAPHRDLAFFVGNQAKRAHVFSVLGVYYPDRS